jgi:hypothetical protein
MTPDMKNVDCLINHLIGKFERNYGIRLTPWARDCLTRAFKIEAQKLLQSGRVH